jgi:hypothetical protein
MSKLQNTRTVTESGHFEEYLWVDCVRGVAPSYWANLMRQHLESRCIVCIRTYHFWETVRAIAAQEHSYSPPELLVASVKRKFFFRHSLVRQSEEFSKGIFSCQVGSLIKYGDSPAINSCS